MLGVLNQIVDEHFSVVNSYGELVSSIPLVQFTPRVYDNLGNDVTPAVGVGFAELGNGHYKYQFTPNALGTWYVTVIHPVYFPHGKTDDVQVYTADLTTIYETVRLTLGLVHHNFYIDDTTYDEYNNLIGARVRIYSTPASVGSDLDVIQTYRIESDGREPGRFTYWSQVQE